MIILDNKKARDLDGQGLIDVTTKGKVTMSSIQQNLLTSNSQPLVIGEFSIRQDEDGRYCLHDLHKASGGNEKHQPAFYLRNKQTKELIEEIDSEKHSANLQSAVKVINGGNDRGTYAVKEMVYAYAMWISAKFHLMVIRAYDALVMGLVSSAQNRDQLKIEDKTTKQERVPLKDAVNLLVAKSKFLNYPDAYGLIHQRFDVGSIGEIPYDQIPAAVEYVHHLIGEYVPKLEVIQDEDLKALKLLDAEIVNKISDWLNSLYTEIKRLNGKAPEYPELNKEDVARAVVTRIVQGQRMLLTVNYSTGKPQVQFIPTDSRILSDNDIAKIVGDREGPRKELLPDIIQAAVLRMSN